MAGAKVKIGGDASQALGAMDEVRQAAARTSQKIKDGFTARIGQRMFDGLIVGAQQAFSAITQGVKAALDAGGELSDQMAQTGASGQGLVVMGQVFKNAGLASVSTAQALNRMQKALAGVNEDGEPTSKVFAQLGLSIGALTQLDPVAAFRAMSDAIAGIPDPAKRAELAMQIFGRTGGDMLVAMTDPGAWKVAKTQVGGLADTLTNAAVDMDGAADSIGALDLRTKQLFSSLAVELLPTIKEVLEKVESMDLSETGARLGNLVEDVLKLGKALAFAAQFTLVFQISKGLEFLANNGGNLTDEEKAATIAKARAEADKLYQSQAGQDFSAAGVAAKTAQIEAEVAHTSAVREASKAYDKARASYESYVLKTQESGGKGGTLAEQLASLDAAEKKIREGMSAGLRGMTPGRAAATLAANDVFGATGVNDGKDMEQIKKLAELEGRRAELTAKKTAEEAAAATQREAAISAYDEELALLAAQVQGGGEKLQQLQREAAIRAEIAKLAQAGITGDEARAKAAALVDARKAAALAEIERGAAGTLADAQAAAAGGDNAQARRAAELEAQGVSAERAKAMAANESGLEKITGLRQQQDGAQFQSTLGAVSSMQRIGGGGGAVSSGLDYSRQQTDLQRQMVEELRAMAARMPLPSLEN